MGWKDDLERTEGYGKIEWAEPEKVSSKALERGIAQLGTLGSGNHYLEIQVARAENIFDEGYGKKIWHCKPEQVVVMVHCGSRGFGHQIGTDYLRIFEGVMKNTKLRFMTESWHARHSNQKKVRIITRQWHALQTWRFANRQVILHRIREGFSKSFQNRC